MSALPPDVMTDVMISARLACGRYDHDIQATVDDVIHIAGVRTGILRNTVGTWIGTQEDVYCRPLCSALRSQIDGMDEHISRGQDIRARGGHSALRR